MVFLYLVIVESTHTGLKRTPFRLDFAGPFPGAQFLETSIVSDEVCALKVSVGIMMFPCFESIASISNLRRSDDGDNTHQDSGALAGGNLM